MTRAERSRKVWAKWEKLVSEQVGSGRSVAVFCRERRLCAPHFFAWKKRLREAAAPRQPQGNEAAPFVEVKLAPTGAERASAGPEASAWPARSTSAAIEVRLRNGRSLVVGPGFDAEHLRALLAAVESGT